MATQGLVTVKSGDKVLMKVVVGCDGMNARKLANRLKKVWPISTQEVYKMALKIGFRCEDCLVVIGSEAVEKDLNYLYRETFQQPRFNPRWLCGTADHIVVIKV